jgi:SAM-dependent methyltransferase
MNIKNDAYGQSLMAQYKDPKYKAEIVERDDNFIEASDYAQRYFSDYSTWASQEKKAINLAKGKILDIGCGAGRHCLYLQKKGFDITGIDNSPGAANVSRLRGVKKTKILSITEIEKLKPQVFDTLLMMGNNFGLFGSPKKAKEILKKMLKITSPNAQIIAECLNPYGTKNPIHLAYHKFNLKRGRMACQLKLRLRYNTTVGEWFDYLFVSEEEMKGIVKNTGWEIKKVYKGAGSTYIAIITKEQV